jgi:hypothetical protein
LNILIAQCENVSNVKHSIYWRIQKLGYKIGDFEEIDKEIARQQFYPRPMLERNVVCHRYGKKYSKIAYFEIAGYRVPQNLVDDIYKSFRIENDIDPSFPLVPSRRSIFEEDLINENEENHNEWIKSNIMFDLNKHLEFTKNNKNFVLLNAEINQRKPSLRRDVYFEINSFFVSKGTSQLILQNKDKFRKPHNFYNEIYGIYSGEFPWKLAETDENLVLSFLIDRIEKIKLGYRFYIEKIWKSDFLYNSFIEKFVNVSINNFIQKEDAYDNFDKELENIFSTNKIIEVPAPSFQNKDIEANLKFQPSVVHLNYGEIKSPIQESFSVILPSVKMCDDLNLNCIPQRFDLRDINGDIATLFSASGEKYHNYQNFTHIRKDLLESYLKESDLELIFVVSFDKRYLFDRNEDIDELIIDFDQCTLIKYEIN